MGKNKNGIVLTIVSFLLVFGMCLSMPAFNVSADDAKQETLKYNAYENFSDLGSPFWNYYFIDCDEGAELKKLAVHGSGPLGDVAPDGTWLELYKYVVSAQDFKSDEYHQYLGIWGGMAMHPGNKADVVLSFVAPVDGIINITTTIKALNKGSDGTLLYTTLNNLKDKIYPENADYVFCSKDSDVEYNLQNFTVKRGDEIFFRLNKNENLSNDNTYFSPDITYISYKIPEELSVEISDKTITMPVGGIRLLEANSTLDLGLPLTYVYTSSDENVAIVKENGLIYSQGAGKAQISVTVKEMGITSICEVIVTNDKTNSEKKGCGANLGVPYITFIFAVLSVVVLFKKIKEENKNNDFKKR